jgi:hypothetical protein
MRYRAYFIDANEYVRSALEIRAGSPAEAVERAGRFKDAHILEVWQIDTKAGQDRLLRRFEQTCH